MAKPPRPPPTEPFRSAADSPEYCNAMAAIASLPPCAVLFLWRTIPTGESIAAMTDLSTSIINEAMKRYIAGDRQTVDRLDAIGEKVKDLWCEKIKQVHKGANHGAI